MLKNKLGNINIFIIPRGRTGGTLLTTMLNSHSDISMGYEIYPDRLEDENGKSYIVTKLLEMLRRTKHKDPDIWFKQLERNNFRVFCARARRSGLELTDILSQIEIFVANKLKINSLYERLDFIDALLLLQARKQKKIYVGSKMRVDPYILYERHPEALQIMMLRDGRDVLDSRLKVGDFNTTPSECANDWVNSLNDFEKFSKNTDALTELVRYEQLVKEPKFVLSNIFDKLGVSFDDNVLRFEECEQPLFQNPHGHLSHEQLRQGLKDTSIGRWRSSLTQAELNDFLSIADSTLEHYGYE